MAPHLLNWVCAKKFIKKTFSFWENFKFSFPVESFMMLVNFVFLKGFQLKFNYLMDWVDWEIHSLCKPAINRCRLATQLIEKFLKAKVNHLFMLQRQHCLMICCKFCFGSNLWHIIPQKSDSSSNICWQRPLSIILKPFQTISQPHESVKQHKILTKS